MPNIGPMEIAIVLIIALIVLGPKRLPDVGKSLGKGMRDFKDSMGGVLDHGEDDEATSPRAAISETRAPAAPQPQAETVAPPAPAPVAAETRPTINA